tara:strand:+ start:349 stop:750 length:402 start_codon:yes stop_codon:yes gene_type:complete
MAITKQTCSQFRTDLNEALAELKKKYDFDIEVGNMRFSSNSISVKLEVADISNPVGANSVNESLFNEYCFRFGLATSHYGKTFTCNKGQRHKIVGIKPRSRKYPILTRNLTTHGDGTEGTTKWNATTIKGFIS